MTLYLQFCQSMEFMERLSYSPLEIQNVQQLGKDTQNKNNFICSIQCFQDTSGLTQGMLLATHLFSSPEGSGCEVAMLSTF